MECGCYVSNVEADFGPEIVYCQMHKAAIETIRLLEAALRKAEGERDRLLGLMLEASTYIKAAAYNDSGGYSENTPDLWERWKAAIKEVESV